jgi:hypothetical protein
MGARASGKRGDPIWGASGPRNSPGCGPPWWHTQARGNRWWWRCLVSKAGGSRVGEELLDGVMLEDCQRGRSVAEGGW